MAILVWTTQNLHPAAYWDREVVESIFTTPGILTGLGMTSTGGFAISIATGKCIVGGSGGTHGVYQGSYHVINDSAISVTTGGPHATNNRIDQIALKIFDQAELTGDPSQDGGQFVVIPGTAQAAASRPGSVQATIANMVAGDLGSVPVNHLVIGYVQVNPGDVGLSAGRLSTFASGQGLYATHVAGLTGKPYGCMLQYTSDATASLSTWFNPPWNNVAWTNANAEMTASIASGYLVIPSTGIWLLHAQFTLSAAAVPNGGDGEALADIEADTGSGFSSNFPLARSRTLYRNSSGSAAAKEAEVEVSKVSSLVAGTKVRAAAWPFWSGGSPTSALWKYTYGGNQFSAVLLTRL